MYLKDKPIKLFRDKGEKYRPVSLYLGNKKIAGYKYSEVTGESLSVLDTYNSDCSVTIKGESVQTVTEQGVNLIDLTKLSYKLNTSVITPDISANSVTMSILNGELPAYANITFILPFDKIKGKTVYFKANTNSLNATKRMTIYTLDSNGLPISLLGIDTSNPLALSYSFPSTLESGIYGYGLLFYLRQNEITSTVITYDNIIMSETDIAYTPFTPNSPSNEYRQPITHTSDFDLVSSGNESQTQTIHFSGSYGSLPDGTADTITIRNDLETTIVQPKLKTVTLSAGNEWTIADAKLNSSFRCTAIKPSTLNGNVLTSAEDITSDFQLTYELAVLPDPISLTYEAVKQYYPQTNVYTNATVQPILEGKFRIIGT